MTWIFENWDRFWEVTEVHLRLSFVPVLIGFVLSIPLGWFASRSQPARAILFPLANILFTYELARRVAGTAAASR